MSELVCHRVARALSERPIFMLPEALRAVIDGLSPRLGLTLDEAKAEKSHFAKMKRSAVLERLAAIADAEPVDVCDGLGEYGLTRDGIAIVPIVGTLIQRYDWLAAYCGMVSYDTISAVIGAAASDSRVRGVILDVDSPGGEASGMLDCADLVRKVSQSKPVWAVANSLAASAGYGLAAAASKLYVPRLGMVGSVGVVCVHIDQSARDAALGLKYTALYSGAHKIDGWGHAPLPDDVRARIQARMDESRAKFAASIASYRGMSTAAVLATEADVYDDDAAVKIGFADAVQSFDETMTAFAAELSGVRSRSSTIPQTGAQAMDTTTIKTPKDKAALAAPKPGADKPAAEAAPVDEIEGDDDETEGDDEPKPSETDAARNSAADIATLCAENGVPGLAAELIKSGATIEQAKERIGVASAIRSMVTDARKLNDNIPATLADDLIASGATIPDASAKVLATLIAGQSAEIRTTVGPVGTGAGANSDAASWDAVISKIQETAARGALPPNATK